MEILIVCHELLHVLYPAFIHCFMDLIAKVHLQEARTIYNTFRGHHEMMHSCDLTKLEGFLFPSHLEFSLELLLEYLHKTQSIMMLGIINEYIEFQVTPRQPSSITDDAEAFLLVGSGQDAANLTETDIRQKDEKSSKNEQNRARIGKSVKSQKSKSTPRRLRMMRPWGFKDEWKVEINFAILLTPKANLSKPLSEEAHMKIKT
ncbi:transcription initiation factor TFIID subunit 5-like protein [Tanacetum coccineum]|uniref:Transcription initiation factor TFIID subunit 5-like protein n=1 Tax=Tanacetum coccineum TaxID=301880 RepID=A0ABQ5B3Z7_9ASTR